MNKIVGALLLALSSFAAAAENVVHHPAPKDPVYLSQSLYETFKRSVPPAPTAKDATQKSDEEKLRALQRTRSAEQCKAAGNEVFVSLKSFFGGPGGLLNQRQIEALSPFFERVRNDGNFFVQKLKVDLPRQRPFAYMKDLEPCVPREVTGAYPSGHATLSKLFALVLGDLLPAKKAAFEARATEIAEHRVIAGVHHPSDIVAGRALAERLYVELKASQKFQADFHVLVGELK